MRNHETDPRLQTRHAPDPGPEDQGAVPRVDPAFRAFADRVRGMAVAFLDPSGRIAHWGRSCELVFGWTRDEAEGRSWTLLYPDGHSEDGGPEEHLARAAAEGEYEGEGHRARRDGSRFWAGVTLTAIREEEGLSGYVMLTRDLSPGRTAETNAATSVASAEQIREEAEEANRRKTTFLSVMSHEIRTPLNGMLGYLDLLESEIGGPITSEQRDYLERARRSGAHVLQLVEEILDLTLVEAGEVRIEARPNPVAKVVATAISVIEPLARRRGLVVQDAVSGSETETVYWGHEDRVRQILTNLLSNALKYTEPGGRITVRSKLTKAPPPGSQAWGGGPWICISVEDTGEGIEAERLEEIFEPFVSDRRSGGSDPPGFGLGLDISRRLARLMEGDLTVESIPGEGSSFHLWLPASPEAFRDEGGERGARPATAAIDPESGRTEVSLRRIGRIILRELERIISAFVGRLRIDPEIRTEHVEDEAVLEDHLRTFLADLGQSLVALDSRSQLGGEDVRAGEEIQRVVTTYHGAKRAALGWSEAELRREYAILREELAAAVRRRSRPGPKADETLHEEVCGILDTAEARSLQGFREAAEKRGQAT